jgi:hypothetical protein
MCFPFTFQHSFVVCALVLGVVGLRGSPPPSYKDVGPFFDRLTD